MRYLTIIQMTIIKKRRKEKCCKDVELWENMYRVGGDLSWLSL